MKKEQLEAANKLMQEIKKVENRISYFQKKRCTLNFLFLS
jgi:hypothetical protein